MDPTQGRRASLRVASTHGTSGEILGEKYTGDKECRPNPVTPLPNENVGVPTYVVVVDEVVCERAPKLRQQVSRQASPRLGGYGFRIIFIVLGSRGKGLQFD